MADGRLSKGCQSARCVRTGVGSPILPHNGVAAEGRGATATYRFPRMLTLLAWEAELRHGAYADERGLVSAEPGGPAEARLFPG